MENKPQRENADLAVVITGDCYTAELTLTDSPMVRVDKLDLKCRLATEGVIRFLFAGAAKLGFWGLSLDLDLEDQDEHYLYHALLDLGARDRTPAEERFKAVDLLFADFCGKEAENGENCPF